MRDAEEIITKFKKLSPVNQVITLEFISYLSERKTKLPTLKEVAIRAFEQLPSDSDIETMIYTLDELNKMRMGSFDSYCFLYHLKSQPSPLPQHSQ